MLRRKEAAYNLGYEKFMNELQVLDDPLIRTPDFRRHLSPPIFMSFKAFTVTGQVQSSAILPISAKNCRNATTLSSWPIVRGQDRIMGDIPRTTCGRVLRITCTVEAQDIFAAVFRRHSDQDEGPIHTYQAPTSLQLSKAERGLRHVRLECPLVRSAQVLLLGEPFTLSSGTRSKAKLQVGQFTNLPM